MSERNLRGAVAAIVLIGEDFVVTPSAIATLKEALAADPDVVALAKEFLQNHTLTDEFGAHWITLEYEIFEAILETRFHIRLVEDDSEGVCYEWVVDDA